MTDDNRRYNIQAELLCAKRALQDARLLLTHGSCQGAVARAYYHAFHCARALLFSLGLETKTHSGVSHLVNFHFVQPGRLSAEVGRILPQLERERQDADYDAAAVFTGEMAGEWVSRAEQYGQAVTNLLSAESWL